VKINTYNPMQYVPLANARSPQSQREAVNASDEVASYVYKTRQISTWW